MTVKPLAKLTGPLRGILVASVIVSVLAMAIDIYAYSQYATLPGTDPSETYLLESDGLNAVAGLVQMGLAVALVVTFLMWVYRANKNLRALSGETLRFTPGWCVGWYFIPFANLFKPYQAMKEIWTVCHRHHPRGHALVQWWWALFLLTNVTGQAAWRSAWDGATVADYRRSMLVYAASDGADAIGQAVALLLVVAIAAAYAARVDESAAAPVAPAAPAAVSAAVVPSLGVVASGQGELTATWVPSGYQAGAGCAATGPSSAPTDGAVGTPAAPPDWHPDPLGRHEWRWWDGAQWTSAVADGGAQSDDPL